MNKFLIAAVCLLSFVVTAVWMWPDPGQPTEGEPPDTLAGQAPPAFPAVTLSDPAAAPPALPGPARLEVLPDGRLKVAPAIRAPLDHYLSAHRHQPLETLVEGF